MNQHFYGVFNPSGELVAAFTANSSYTARAVDAFARYDWKAMGEALYWTISPQPVTIARIEIDMDEFPEVRHKLIDDPFQRCSCFHCPVHTPAQYYYPDPSTLKAGVKAE